MDPTPTPRRRFGRLRAAALIVLLLVAAGTLAGWFLVRASLPPLTGRLTLAGLHAPVAVERDANGVPTIRASDREDLMRALGCLHAQDRFFEMDLLRRQAAGELSGLFGPALLPVDKEARRYRFRRQAQQVVRRAPPDKLRVLKAYTEGVNAGLAALRVRPWEYLLLRAAPRPWQPEDTVLVVDAMAVALEDHGADERTRLALADVYGEETTAFLQPLVTEATAALDGSSVPAPPVPDAAQMRPRTPEPPPAPKAGTPLAPRPAGPVAALFAGWPGMSAGDGGPAGADARPGSNNFALAGRRVAGGGALVANDPHLGLSVPALWYRVSLALPAGTGTGASLPGVPALVLGSNGHVAWGFTNGQIDTSDIVLVERDNRCSMSAPIGASRRRPSRSIARPYGRCNLSRSPVAAAVDSSTAARTSSSSRLLPAPAGAASSTVRRAPRPCARSRKALARDVPNSRRVVGHLWSTGRV